jgi:hypothetical protein
MGDYSSELAALLESVDPAPPVGGGGHTAHGSDGVTALLTLLGGGDEDIPAGLAPTLHGAQSSTAAGVTGSYRCTKRCMARQAQEPFSDVVGFLEPGDVVEVLERGWAELDSGGASHGP